jgi:ABC-type multidrug transport system fused ATPase/permease subunit
MIALIRDLVRPYRRLLAVVLAAMTLETVMSLAVPWPMKIVLDNVIGGRNLPSRLAMFQGGGARVALLAGIATLLIAAIGAVGSYVESYFSESLAQRVAHDLRMRTYHHLQSLSLAYYDKHRVSASLTTLTTDIETIQDFASSGTLSIVVDLLSVVGMLVLMFWMNWEFALLASAVAPFLLWFVSRFKKAVKSATRQVRLSEAEIVAVEMYGLESQRVIKAFGTQNLEESRLRTASCNSLNSALQARKIKSSLSPVVSVTVAACTAVVLWRGADLVLSGAMSIGVLSVFLAYLTRFFKPAQDLAKMSNAIAQTGVAAERVQAILQTDETIPERPDARPAESLRGEIVFDRVAFGYDSGAQVLRDVSFRIEPGQFVGLVGPTGSGKSTVISLIPRFYDPTAGAVMVDGIDARTYQLQGLRHHFSFVLQDTVLFHGTVAENIAYGRPGASDAEIVAAARMANAQEFIERMPAGYQTLVGDRGMTLSGGQRQRLGIARALIRNSPVLILDEPTAALDPEAEQNVMDALDRLMKGRTVIMIAHRLATLRNADKVIVIKNGVVAEEGSQAELLALGGVYSALYRAQDESGVAGGTR